jgi:FkbM family methyltransferase
MIIKLKRMMRVFSIRLRLFLLISIILVVGWYAKLIFPSHQITTAPITTMMEDFSIGSHVHIVDPDLASLDRNFSCIKTKRILNLFESTICIYSEGDTVSSDVAVAHVWEENEMTRILRILIRNPHMDMIDIGANIGGFTMFTAGALGRFTLAVDCYLPNIERIARAVQIQRIQNRVVLVQNAVYSKAGESLKIENNDPSGIRLSNDTYKKTRTGHFIAKSIRFDDLLPILKKRGVRTALIKIDIETSESYMCETGSKVFQEIDIPFVMMEWHNWKVNHQKRYQFIVDFFTERNYVPTDENCQEISTSTWLTEWSATVFWIKRIYINETFC